MNDNVPILLTNESLLPRAAVEGDLCKLREINEMPELFQIARERKAAGSPLTEDEYLHSALLISNGWPVKEAIEESIRTLADATVEGIE